jgi:hypothetical protein
MLNALKRVIITGIISKKYLNIYRAADHTSHLIEITGHSTLTDISSTL